MNDPHPPPDRLQKEIAAAHEAARMPLTQEEVAALARQAVQSLQGDMSAADLKFYAELEALALYIRQAKRDIAAIRPDDINTSFIPGATGELDAVVGATEEATNRIMDICDEVTAIAGQCPPEQGQKLVACTTRIFEACNFQDISGQRIAKVVQALKHIDSRIEAIVKAMGGIRNDSETKPVEPVDPDRSLLNGPQLPQNAVSQDDIDRLLSDS